MGWEFWVGWILINMMLGSGIYFTGYRVGRKSKQKL